MSNLPNLPGVIIEITSKSYHVTQTKNENKQAMEAKDACFCKKSFIDRSFLILDPPWLHKPRKPMVNRVKPTGFNIDASIVFNREVLL